MKNFLMIAQLLASLYPILMQTIKAIEEALPDGGNGALKLELVKKTLEAAYLKMDDTKLKFEEVWPSIQLVVGAIVTMLNTAGIFKKK